MALKMGTGVVTPHKWSYVPLHTTGDGAHHQEKQISRSAFRKARCHAKGTWRQVITGKRWGMHQKWVKFSSDTCLHWIFPPKKVSQINTEAIPKAPEIAPKTNFSLFKLHPTLLFQRSSSIPMGASGQNSSAGGCGAVGRRKWRRGGGIPAD